MHKFVHLPTADFLTVPSDACASPGDVVDFRCTTVFTIGDTVLPGQQEWVVTPPSGPSIQFSSEMAGPAPPTGFSFIRDPDLSGIRATATSILNNATFQCIALQPNTGDRNYSALVIATLQVAGTATLLHSTTFPYFLLKKKQKTPCLLPSGEPCQFSCEPVSCPPLYSPGVDTTCTVQWSAPWTVDCAPLTSYTITVTRRDNGEVVSSSSQSPWATGMHNITISEPAVDYMVTIVAVNRIGPNNCAVEFMSPKQQSRCVFNLVNTF